MRRPITSIARRLRAQAHICRCRLGADGRHGRVQPFVQQPGVDATETNQPNIAFHLLERSTRERVGQEDRVVDLGRRTPRCCRFCVHIVILFHQSDFILRLEDRRNVQWKRWLLLGGWPANARLSDRMIAGGSRQRAARTNVDHVAVADAF